CPLALLLQVVEEQLQREKQVVENIATRPRMYHSYQEEKQRRRMRMPLGQQIKTAAFGSREDEGRNAGAQSSVLTSSSSSSSAFAELIYTDERGWEDLSRGSLRRVGGQPMLRDVARLVKR
ncbi:unnamed protein product, partial [Amoebophrya sp. A25]